jgi:hypothetical protein
LGILVGYPFGRKSSHYSSVSATQAQNIPAEKFKISTSRFRLDLKRMG